MMTPEKIHLRIASHPENLKKVRRVILDVTAKTSLAKEDKGSIILAIDEACSNIIRHSYKNDYTRKIDLIVKRDTHSIAISIIDEGIGFDINSIEERDIAEIRPGGLGVYIIKEIMDTVESGFTLDGKNKIKLIKKLS